mmetsp:Transcript_11870/g.27007  ORF Transcript_11870/g.27007 Transcript_11870/m.27007 type:complete len:473 (-) Transcript_11870:8-1426(-)
MLIYDNSSYLKILCSRRGSVCWNWRVVVPASLGAAWGTLVNWQFEEEINDPDVDEPVRHFYAISAIGFVLIFATVFRSKLSWNRYWEAVTQTQMMFSKWADAYMQISTFMTTSTEVHLEHGDFARAEFLMKYRRNVLHWMTLLGASAVYRLSRGDLTLQARATGWNDQIALRQQLRTSYSIPAAPKVRSTPAFDDEKLFLPGLDFYRKVMRPPHEVFFGPGLTLRSSRKSRRCVSGKLYAMREEKEYGNEMEALNILCAATPCEMHALSQTTDAVQTCLTWITEAVGRCEPLLVTPPPVLSRAYQELSNGMLGFNQALKLADIPFPFPYAQLLAVLLGVFCIVAPIYMAVFSANLLLTPLMSYALLSSLLAVNWLSIELENPFGDAINNLPLVDGHERFVDNLWDQYLFCVPPCKRFGTEVSFVHKYFNEISRSADDGAASSPSPLPDDQSRFRGLSVDSAGGHLTFEQMLT